MGQFVQVPGSVGFGGQDGVEALGGEVGEEGVVEDAGGVDDGGEVVSVQEVGDGVAVAGVAGGDGDVGAVPAEFGVEFGGSGCVRSAPAGEQEPAGAVVGDEVPGEERAEGAGATGDQHGPVRVDCGGYGQHDLADVPGLAEVPEGGGCLADVECGDR
ncbi:hypothetical protein GCM10027610_060080 [Dactylosporangium cerinum]